ncbi:MAG: DUF2238 domain-containing protein [Moraxellaceae bacterium]|nr:MAG: DUF2238 domain-containing protein [Moraxellaceae bacterium]
MKKESVLVASAVLLVLLVAFTGVIARDHTTWILEVFPILIALPVLAFTYRKFPLTNLLYVLIFMHAIILMTGGVYSYAKVPLGFYLQDLFDLSRNPYDKIGHFVQGFVPALIAREILIRGNYVRGKKMLAFLVVCIILAISATYELIEWATALILGQGAEEFLGTQGDQWDTQSDMFFAVIGAVVAIVCLTRFQDKQIVALEERK